jgi:hypothetical protein
MVNGECFSGAFTAAFSGRRDWRSGVSAERRHLKKSGKVSGGLPTRRYEAGESFVVPVNIRMTGFAGRSAEKPETCNCCSFSPGEKVRLRAGIKHKSNFAEKVRLNDRPHPGPLLQGEGESSAVILKIRTTEFAGRHPQNQTQPFAST